MAASGFEMVRYADDFVILCQSKEQAEAALDAVRSWTAQAGGPISQRLQGRAVTSFDSDTTN